MSQWTDLYKKVGTATKELDRLADELATIPSSSLNMEFEKQRAKEERELFFNKNGIGEVSKSGTAKFKSRSQNMITSFWTGKGDQGRQEIP